MERGEKWQTLGEVSGKGDGCPDWYRQQRSGGRGELMSPLSRRFVATIPVDAATVAIGVPSAFPEFDECGDRAEALGAITAHTGADGAYGAYEVLDETGAVVGAEVVISSPLAQEVLDHLIVDQLGWAPDKDFYDRYFSKTSSSGEERLFEQYRALELENFSRILRQTVETADPSDEARALAGAGGDIVVADGRLAVCDPWCFGSGHDIIVSPGTYRPVRWVDKGSDSSQVENDTVRIGVYRDDVVIGSPPMPLFDVFTTRGHAARFEADSAEHATDLFLGKAMPPGIPPAPRPAETTRGPTPGWRDWYKNKFLPVRRRYPTLDWARGECLSSVHPAGERECPGQYDPTLGRWGPCSICAPADRGTQSSGADR